MAGSPRKRARRERAEAKADPLDETYRPPLGSIPWNKASLTDEGREAVALALLEGYPRNQIAKALGTSVKTLKRLIDDDPVLGDAIEARKDAEEAELRDILMDLARKGDTVAAIFLGKSQFGWRDRDDGKVQIDGKAGGVLLLPTAVPLDDWEAAAAAQQAQYREANPATDPSAPGADKIRADAQRGTMRTRTLTHHGVMLEKTALGDLTH